MNALSPIVLLHLDTRPHRFCRKCDVFKPLVDFKKNKSGRNGYTNTCKVCHKAETAQWKKDNPDRQKSYKATYRKTDKGKAAASRERHARRAAIITARHEPWNRFDLYDRDNGLCHHCKLPVERDNFHADHLYPLMHENRFGAQVMGDRAENLAPAHEGCNLERSNLVIAEDKLIELALPMFEKTVRGFSKYMEQLQNVV